MASCIDVGFHLCKTGRLCLSSCGFKQNTPQLVKHLVAIQKVEGSTPFTRSIYLTVGGSIRTSPSSVGKYGQAQNSIAIQHRDH